MKWLGAFSVCVLVLLLAPLTFVMSRGMSLEAFSRLASRADLIEACLNSAILAFISATTATLLGTLTAWALPALPGRLRRIVNISLAFPMILPEIALGLSLLIWFVRIGWSLGWGTLLAGHVAFSLSYATLVLKTRIESMDLSLVDAAQDLGAGPWAVFRAAYWPQLAPGVAASFLTCFSLSLDDFLISFFVKGLDQMTLPVQLYSMMRIRLQPEIYALSLLLFCLSVSIVLLSQLWLSSKKVSSL